MVVFAACSCSCALHCITAAFSVAGNALCSLWQCSVTPAYQLRALAGCVQFVQARSVLALTSVPRTLPCRETERGQVAAFVEEVLAEGWWCCCCWACVSSMPAT